MSASSQDDRESLENVTRLVAACAVVNVACTVVIALLSLNFLSLLEAEVSQVIMKGSSKNLSGINSSRPQPALGFPVTLPDSLNESSSVGNDTPSDPLVTLNIMDDKEDPSSGGSLDPSKVDQTPSSGSESPDNPLVTIKLMSEAPNLLPFSSLDSQKTQSPSSSEPEHLDSNITIIPPTPPAPADHSTPRRRRRKASWREPLQGTSQAVDSQNALKKHRKVHRSATHDKTNVEDRKKTAESRSFQGMNKKYQKLVADKRTKRRRKIMNEAPRSSLHSSFRSSPNVFKEKGRKLMKTKHKKSRNKNYERHHKDKRMIYR